MMLFLAAEHEHELIILNRQVGACMLSLCSFCYHLLLVFVLAVGQQKIAFIHKLSTTFSVPIVLGCFYCWLSVMLVAIYFFGNI